MCHYELWKCPLRTEFSFVQAESTELEQNNKGRELLRCHFGTTQHDVTAAPAPRRAHGSEHSCFVDISDREYSTSVGDVCQKR